MPLGDTTGLTFAPSRAEEIRRTLRRASKATGLNFSVFVGPAKGASRPYALSLLTEFGSAAPLTVLIFVDPDAHQLEIVTGAEARLRVDDRACGLAAISIASAFSLGGLARGINIGIDMLAEHARRNYSLNVHDPG